IDIDIKGNDRQDILNKLIQYCAKLSVKLEFKTLSDGLYGYNSNGLIAINSAKSVNTQASTLIHEIAHELLHKNSNPSSRQQREIQAEAVAYAVSNCLGIQSKGFNYLALYDADYKKIMENLALISEASKKIMSEIRETA
ncbi:MAG: ImmA/IrrE family metallo-endopeptidase, partial [Nanoarchaeota archaeon]